MQSYAHSNPSSSRRSNGGRPHSQVQVQAQGQPQPQPLRYVHDDPGAVLDAKMASGHLTSAQQHQHQQLASQIALAQQQQQQLAAAEIQIQIQLQALNNKIIKAQTLAQLNGWTLDDALIKVWGGLTDDEVKLLKLKALREEQARREQEVLNMRLMQQQQQQEHGQRGGLRHLDDELQQNARQIELAQSQLRALQEQTPQSSAYEQRQAAKHQIEANLRARSGKIMMKAVMNGQGRHAAQNPPFFIEEGRAASPTQSVPSPAHSQDSSRRNRQLPAGLPFQQRNPHLPFSDTRSDGSPSSESGSSFFDRTPSRRANPTSPPTSVHSPSSPGGSDDLWPNEKPSLRALRRHASRSTEDGSEPGRPKAGIAVAVAVVRQPLGPPSGADELGDRNFASRVGLSPVRMAAQAQRMQSKIGVFPIASC